MSTIELAIPAQAAHVRTARLIVVAAARHAGLSDDSIDELRLAVGEACGRAVALHLRHAPDAPVRVLVRDDGGSISVEVVDLGPPPERWGGEVSRLLQEAPGDPDVALAFLSGMVEDLSVTTRGDGTRVRLRWPLLVSVS